MKEQNNAPAWCDEELLKDDDFFSFTMVSDPYSWDGSDDNNDSIPVPPELHGKMADARLIEPGFESYAWEVTPLGKQYGLVSGCLPLDGGRSCHTFFIQKTSLEKLKDLLSVNRTGQGAPWKTIPIGDRLKRLSSGLPGNDTYGVELLKKLGKMPLKQYMASCPSILDNLRKEYPGVRTVQEAATQISASWRADPDSRERCKSLIWGLLAWPSGNLKQFPNYC